MVSTDFAGCHARGQNPLSPTTSRLAPNRTSTACWTSPPLLPPHPPAASSGRRFPGASRRAREARPARAHRPADQQGHRAASAGALAVRRRRRRGRAARVPLHQRRRRQAAGATTSRSRSARSRRRRRSMRSAWAARSRRSARPGCDAIAHPIPPVRSPRRPARRSCSRATTCAGPAAGLQRLPVPVSTPGFDAAPYLTATLCITRDPDTGIQNMGMYRAALKATDRLAVRMVARPPAAPAAICTGSNTASARSRCRSPS